MRHFAHHIGDYAAATAHLSMLEDAAYHRLLRLYYQNEGPLTTDENELMRRVRAVSRHEKTAVRSVLQEFFTLSSDGWHQSRADKELSVFKRLAEGGRIGGLKRKARQPLANPSKELEPTTTHYPLPTTHNPKEESEVAPKRSPTGSRLPDDFQLSAEDVAFAEQLGLSPVETSASFCDYWHGVAGAKGRKADWSATWRNWCRREAANVKQRSTSRFAKPEASATHIDGGSEWTARLRGWQQGKFWKPELGWGPPPGSPGCLVPPHLLKEAA